MFKSMQNLAKISFVLKPQGPLLVKSGDTIDPTGPDMAFVRLMTPRGRTICLPGSSLKGVVRSSAEALLRLYKLDPPICDPSNTKTLCPELEANKSKKRDGKLPYDGHCRVCQTLGSTDLASRVSFSDLLPWPPEATPQEQERAIEQIQRYINVRMGISIDRRKSGVAHGPFEMETLSGGTLYGEVTLRNFRLWQAGLIFFLFDQIDRGLFRLGFAKSRGLGRVHIQPTSLNVEQFGSLARGSSAALREAGESPSDIPVEMEPQPQPFGQSFTFEGSALGTVKKQLLKTLIEEFEQS